MLGKGDAMWRALSVLSGELICFIDADIEDFSAHFVSGLIGPLVELRRSTSSRASTGARSASARSRVADGGGRVNHLLARPALAVFYPELAGSTSRSQARSPRGASCSSASRSPPATASRSRCCSTRGESVGLDGLAQVDLDEHRNRHQPLSALERDGL